MRRDFLLRYGPCALVTGASSGIGEQFARQLAALGLDVIVTARRAERLEKLAADLEAQHAITVTVLPVDLAAPDGADAVLRGCADHDIGLVVSNAGLGLKGTHENQTAQELTDLVAVNCLVPTVLAHAFVPRLIERGGGGLLFVGSIEGVGGFPWSAAYSASKAYVESLGEALWAELRPRGVDSLVLAPGSTATEIHDLQGIDTKALTGVMSPAAVAAAGLRHLGRGPYVTPGVLNRTLVMTMKTLPRSLRVRAAGMGMRRTLERSKNPRV